MDFIIEYLGLSTYPEQIIACVKIVVFTVVLTLIFDFIRYSFFQKK